MNKFIKLFTILSIMGSINGCYIKWNTTVEESPKPISSIQTTVTPKPEETPTVTPTPSPTPIPAPSQTTLGAAGYTVRFNGVNTYIKVPNNDKLNFKDHFTIQIWVKPENFSKNKYFPILSKGNELSRYALTLRTDKNLLVKLNHTAVNMKDNEYQEDVWSHITLTWNGSELILYRNGIFVSKNTYDKGLFVSKEDDLIIGADFSEKTFFEGSFDDIRLWNRTLEQSEIRSNINLSLKGDEDGLIAYWKMDEGKEDNLIDNSKSNINAKLVNTQNWKYSSAPLYN